MEYLTEFTTKLELIQQFSARNIPIYSFTSSKNHYFNGKETKETVSDTDLGSYPTEELVIRRQPPGRLSTLHSVSVYRTQSPKGSEGPFLTCSNCPWGHQAWVLCWCPLPPDPSHPDSWPLLWSSTSTFLLDHHTHYYYSYLPNEKFGQSKYEVSMAAISPVTPLSSPLHHRSLSIPVLKLQSKSLLLLLPD